MLNYILLQAPAAGAQQGSGLSTIIMLVLLVAVFYFFMIRPQQKKQKELQKQRDAMKKGDKVVSAGGIHGIIKEVQETTILVEVAKDVVMKFDKGSIYATAEDAAQAQPAKEEGAKK